MAAVLRDKVQSQRENIYSKMYLMAGQYCLHNNES